MSPLRRIPTAEHERGAVLILTAMFMLVIMIIAATVLDLGQLRSTRRSDQTAADLAALSAGAYLSGHASDPAVSDPRGACLAALNSIKANVGDFPAGATMNCNSLPATGTPPDCQPNTAMATYTATGAAPYQLTIDYPVPDSAIAESRFAGGGANDGLLPCERMRITLTRTNEPFFAGVMGVESMEVAASSTVRASNGQVGSGTAALLLLERVGCPTIDANAPSGGGIRVEPSGDSPGVIQVDSAGVVGSEMCSSNDNANGWTAYGRILSSNNEISIQAISAPNGDPGIVGLYALSVGGRGANVNGVKPDAVAVQRPMSRAPVDEKYNGEHAQITTLHADGYHLVTKTAPIAALAGFTVIGCDAPPVVNDARIYVNCSDFKAALASVGGTRFPNAVEVVFNGKVSISGNALLSMPRARRVYVRGCGGTSPASPCNGGNFYSMQIAGELRVNTGGDGTTAPSCASIASATNTAVLATFGGPLRLSGGVARLCQTFVYLGENTSTYLYRAHTSPFVSSTYSYPAVARCSEELPCPSGPGVETGAGAILVGAGSPVMDWTAPNQLTQQPEDTDWATHPFEDLALWTESNQTSEIKGQGTSSTAGVYFAPNATVNFSGQAEQSQPLNAQFIARRFLMSGQGTLSLRPNASDSVQTPIPGGWSLIR